MKRVVLVIGLSLLPLAAHAECKDPSKTPPTLAQMPTLPTADLYVWLTLARRASDAVATAAAVGRKDPVSPCVQELMDRRPAFERELRFR
ncbi:hypothetical protein ACIPUD_10925 [Bradyrhizobium sp. CAR08]